MRTATDWLTIALSASGGRVADCSHRTNSLLPASLLGYECRCYDRTKSYVSDALYELSLIFIICGRWVTDFSEENGYSRERYLQCDIYNTIFYMLEVR